MSTLLEYRTDLEAMLSIVNLSGFFTDAIKDQFINTAGKRVYNYDNWSWLNHALKTNSVALEEYYEQSSRFKNGSIFRITVGEGTEEVEHDIISLNLYKENKAQETGERLATIIGNQYFIYPILTEDNEVIGTYGQLKWVKLSSDTDESISPVAFDESIVKMAFAQALKKERRFSEANSEIDEVENPNTGILARLHSNDTKQTPKGFVGVVKSTRWD